jgi:Peptidase A4 family
MSSLRVGTAIAVVGAFGFAIATSTSAEPAGQHGPVEVNRNDDGSLKRGPHYQIDTSNWSGYAIANFQTGKKYTSAQSTWVVPTVTYGGTDAGASNEYSSNWVGIGGFCMNALCTRGDRTLIQLGTEQDVSPSGSTNYSAWYELIPQFPVTIPLTISPGDTINASLQCVSACSAKKQNWLLSMTDVTTNQSWSTTLSYGSSLASAEWIEEAPYSNGVLPLADFNVANFLAGAATGTANGLPVLTLSANGIQMTDPWGQTANPSSTNGSDGFNVCWNYGPFVPCTAP